MVVVVGERQLEPVHVREQLCVARRGRLAQGENRVELLELTDSEGGADIVDAVVEPEPRVVEPAAAVGAALVAQAHKLAPRVLRVRRDDAALSRGHLLVRVEGEDRIDALRAEPAALVLRAERLAGVLDQDEVVLLGQRPERIELAGVAEDVHGDDALRPLGDRRLDCCRFEVHGPLVDVGEDGRRAFVDEAVRRGDERVRRRDHLVARSEAGEDRE